MSDDFHRRVLLEALRRIREGNLGTEPARLEPPRLALVTPANAHSFTPTPKKRGRPQKVRTSGNVVAIADLATDRDWRRSLNRTFGELIRSGREGEFHTYDE